MTNPTKLQTDAGKIYCKYCRFPVENVENAENDLKHGVHASCLAEIKDYLKDQFDVTRYDCDYNAEGELIRLSLAEKGLTKFPEIITFYPPLKKLDLGYNRIPEVPESIGNLRNLEHLDLRSNSLFILPNTIGDLAKLHFLDISDNFLTTLPKTIGDIKYLHFLYVNRNSIMHIPRSILQLVRLRKLEITSIDPNKIRHILIELMNRNYFGVKISLTKSEMSKKDLDLLKRFLIQYQ